VSSERNELKLCDVLCKGETISNFRAGDLNKPPQSDSSYAYAKPKAWKKSRKSQKKIK
jgi:hypothetical protein